MERVCDTLLTLKNCDGSAELPRHRFEHRKGGLASLRPKAIKYAAKSSVLTPFVNVWIVAVEIAQARLEAIRALLKDEEPMSLPPGD
jgi:hypothetical protein